MSIIEEYDGQSLYPMLLKCYHYLHPMTESRVGRAYQIGDAQFDLNIFQQTPNTSEPITKLVNKEMLIFRWS